jgi:hypothetical protein
MAEGGKSRCFGRGQSRPSTILGSAAHNPNIKPKDGRRRTEISSDPDSPGVLLRARRKIENSQNFKS